MHSDATQADREKLNRGKSPYIPRNLRFPSCKPSELDAKARTRNRRFFDFEKTKKNQKGKKRKNKLTNNYLILKLKKILYIIFILVDFAVKFLKINAIYGRIGSYRCV